MILGVVFAFVILDLLFLQRIDFFIFLALVIVGVIVGDIVFQTGGQSLVLLPSFVEAPGHEDWAEDQSDSDDDVVGVVNFLACTVKFH